MTTEPAVTGSSPDPLNDLEAMDLAGIGRLIHTGDIWRLTYVACGHVQDLPRQSLDADDAAAEVRRDYGHCLICAQAQSHRGASRRQTRERL
jgi:hypothetical protein